MFHTIEDVELMILRSQMQNTINSYMYVSRHEKKYLTLSTYLQIYIYIYIAIAENIQ